MAAVACLPTGGPGQPTSSLKTTPGPLESPALQRLRVPQPLKFCEFRIASGLPSGMACSISSGITVKREYPLMDARRELLENVRNMIRQDQRAAAAFAALRGRGSSEQYAEEELARAFLGCMWEAGNGYPDRFTEVLQAIENGRTCQDLFPDDFYSKGKPNGSA
jgi:hypothetical protein